MTEAEIAARVTEALVGPRNVGDAVRSTKYPTRVGYVDVVSFVADAHVPPYFVKWKSGGPVNGQWLYSHELMDA